MELWFDKFRATSKSSAIYDPFSKSRTSSASDRVITNLRLEPHTLAGAMLMGKAEGGLETGNRVSFDGETHRQCFNGKEAVTWIIRSGEL